MILYNVYKRWYNMNLELLYKITSKVWAKEIKFVGKKLLLGYKFNEMALYKYKRVS